MHLNYFDIICIISICQLLLFSIFLITHKRGKKQNNKILALFLLAQVFGIFDILVFHIFEYTHRYFPHAFFIGYPFKLLWAPTLYFYCRSLTSAHFSIKRHHVFHFLPFLFLSIYFVSTYHFYTTDTKRLLLANYSILNIKQSQFITIFTHLQILSYILVSLYVLQKYRSKIKAMFSSLTKINLAWFRFILYGYIFAWASSLVVSSVYINTGNYIEYMREINMTVFLLFFNIIFYKGLSQPEIFSDQGEKVTRKYGQSTLTEAQANKYLKILKSIMKNEKPYLRSDLNIRDLANELSMPPRHLSQVINEKLNQNFHDFVNHYRVEEAKTQLIKNEYQSETILAIAYDSGFNSKSSFNFLFKKYVKMTPSQFRKKYFHT